MGGKEEGRLEASTPRGRKVGVVCVAPKFVLSLSGRKFSSAGSHQSNGKIDKRCKKNKKYDRFERRGGRGGKHQC